MAHGPDIAVVVASHDRPMRLRRLLDALAAQSMSADRFEVLVGHDSAGPETDELLSSHPLASDGRLRHVRLAAGTAPPGANRNAAWRLARAPFVAFTDDDCRPPPDWVECALAAARRDPGSIVQGRTRPDPDEDAAVRAMRRHTQSIDPPIFYAQACNIVYPRELLERLGGFDESLSAGEDMELAARARQAGTPYVGAPEALTYHAVIALTLGAEVRGLLRWRALPKVVGRHPELRRRFYGLFFWQPTHAWLPLALLGGALARRRPLLALAALPYLRVAYPAAPPGAGPRAWLRKLPEFLRNVATDLVEIGVLARGSARARTFFI